MRRWLLAFLVITAASCQRTVPPRLAEALTVRGAPVERARVFLRVALQGTADERRRAALLWGLTACETGAPAAALTAFGIARPPGGRGKLAARRLGEALESSHASEALWRRAIGAAWLGEEDRVRLRVRAGEALLQDGESAAALRVVGEPGGLSGEVRARALAVVARSGAAAAAPARRALAIEFPQRFSQLLPGEDVRTASATLRPAELVEQARAWLDAGHPEPALATARRAGPAGALVAARACLRLRHASQALAWAARLGEGDGKGWLERAEAYRQIAWGQEASRRARPFAEMLHAAERASRLLTAASTESARAELQLAEAFTELGRFAQAAPFLGRAEVKRQPRWEWVARRFIFLQANKCALADDAVALAGGSSTRGRRLAAFWKAALAGPQERRDGLERLAASGFPDLPAQWASEALGRRGVAVELSGQPFAAPPPPAWATDLLEAGRVADAVVAWRADLEAAGHDGPAWLGLARLADLPPLDAIPLLAHGEPRLLSGPWTGLSRDLLRRYLPLPWRAEVEAAARRAGIPPWVLAGVVRQESAWNPAARSAAGAIGLTQVLPGTGAELARQLGLPPGIARNLTEPAGNLTLGALLLARAHATAGGSWPVALASYNAGERRVKEPHGQTDRADGPEFVESIEIPETWDYVHRVVLLAEGYRIVYWPEGKAFPWT